MISSFSNHLCLQDQLTHNFMPMKEIKYKAPHPRQNIRQRCKSIRQRDNAGLTHLAPGAFLYTSMLAAWVYVCHFLLPLLLLCSCPQNESGRCSEPSQLQLNVCPSGPYAASLHCILIWAPFNFSPMFNLLQLISNHYKNNTRIGQKPSELMCFASPKSTNTY